MTVLGFIGGTGPEGRGLALRLAMVGHDVIIGSRDAERALQAAAGVSEAASHLSVKGGLNADAASESETVFVTLPYAAQSSILAKLSDSLAGKTVVSVVAPLAFRDGVAQAVAVPDGSAALEAQALLPTSKVVGAFQTISAHDLLDPDKDVDSDVVVCADDVGAKDEVMRLAESIAGVKAVNGGGLSNAGYVENVTPLLLNINKIYKAHSAIKIAGI